MTIMHLYYGAAGETFEAFQPLLNDFPLRKSFNLLTVVICETTYAKDFSR